MSLELLKVESRKASGSRASNRLRKSGYLPAVICSKNADSISVKVETSSLKKSLNALGRSAVFKLQIDNKNTISAMIKDIDFQPLTNDYLCVTFQQVSLKEDIKADVAIRVINTDNLEINKLSISMHVKTLTITGLPQDIPNYIDIDGTNMQGGDNLFVKDIKLPEAITVDAEPETMILSVLTPKIHAEEEEKAEDLQQEQPASKQE